MVTAKPRLRADVRMSPEEFRALGETDERIYAEAGVREYWICDPHNDTALLLELRDGRYVERAALAAGDALGTPLLPGLSIPLADAFRHPRRPRRDE